MKENIKKAAQILRIDPHILEAIVAHAKEIQNQFELLGNSSEDNIHAVKIILQDNDANWYVSQDEPNNDSLWADARNDDREGFDDGDEDDDEDDDDDGGMEIRIPEKVLT